MTGAVPPGGSWSEFAGARGSSGTNGPGGAGEGPRVRDAGPRADGDPEATLHLPPVASEPPPGPFSDAGSDRTGPSTTRPALIGRFTVSLAGLLVAGCLVLGVGLVVLMLVVPGTGGSGYDYATGPGWSRTVAHLAVGVVGEIALQWSRRRSWQVRVTVSVVASVLVLLVLALSWWR